MSYATCYAHFAFYRVLMSPATETLPQPQLPLTCTCTFTLKTHRATLKYWTFWMDLPLAHCPMPGWLPEKLPAGVTIRYAQMT